MRERAYPFAELSEPTLCLHAWSRWRDDARIGHKLRCEACGACVFVSDQSVAIAAFHFTVHQRMGVHEVLAGRRGPEWEPEAWRESLIGPGPAPRRDW